MRFTSKNLLLGLVAIVLASCASTPDTHSSKGQVATEPTVTRPAPAKRCDDCGVIQEIVFIRDTQPSGAKGAVLGGVIGAIAGREIVDDDSSSKKKNQATLAGAAVGAVAGNQIQKRMNREYLELKIRMDDGSTVLMNHRDLGGEFKVGSRVRISGNSLFLID